MCGEKRQDRLDYYVPQGSPPRMRGKVPFSIECGFCRGITPAYAGKSAFGLLSSAESGDYPRVCGEKRVLSSPSFAKIGSPPRMRGKEGVALLSGQIVGITPAYAGKRAAANFHLGTTRDHPRVCGEKRMPPRIGFWLRGSPPRMRGKEGAVLAQLCKDRITPAYAGKRGCRTLEWPDCRDHPRVCGEKGCCKFSSRNHSGSPPRMRGKADAATHRFLAQGITPACAGKSRCCWSE